MTAMCHFCDRPLVGRQSKFCSTFCKDAFDQSQPKDEHSGPPIRLWDYKLIYPHRPYAEYLGWVRIRHTENSL